MLPTHRAPIHPGEMLLEEFLKPAGMTRRDAAAKMKMSVSATYHSKTATRPSRFKPLGQE